MINLRHMLLSVLYAAALSWLLLYEIVPQWSYMNYVGEYTLQGFLAALGASAVLGMSVPLNYDGRTMLIGSLNYLYFVPSAVYIYLSYSNKYHLYSFIILSIGVYYISRINVYRINFAEIRQNTALTGIAMLIILAVVAQIAFGGLRYFSLDIGSVYEFRDLAAREIPSLFGYIFSNVASVLVPVGLILSVRLRRFILAGLMMASAVVLFGMTQHKSVLFTPFVVVILYFCFIKGRSPYLVGGAFLIIPLLAIAEVFYVREVIQSADVPYFNSIVVRRLLFTPVMLDSLYTDFFSHNPKLYWSTSKFGSWAVENIYNNTAPYIIGIEYFSSDEMAANSGAIGSGFSHFGLFGVIIYSVAIGFTISILNSYGNIIGHAFVAAVSLKVIFGVVTTTDFTTGLLSHGLILLLVVLGLFSSAAQREKRESVMQK